MRSELFTDFLAIDSLAIIPIKFSLQIYLITNAVMFCFAGKCVQFNCNMFYIPVCASNGISYPNKCHLLKAQCLNPAITLKYNGSCKKSSPNYC